jgi:hypothetical protein
MLMGRSCWLMGGCLLICSELGAGLLWVACILIYEYVDLAWGF